MKTYIKFIIAMTILLVFASCGDKKAKEEFGNSTEEIAETPLLEQGKTIFEEKGTCTACHKPNVKVVGPSLADISKTYKEKKASIVSFLKGEGEAIVDPSQYEVMKANFAITKSMSEEELKALETYITSF